VSPKPVSFADGLFIRNFVAFHKKIRFGDCAMGGGKPVIAEIERRLHNSPSRGKTSAESSHPPDTPPPILLLKWGTSHNPPLLLAILRFGLQNELLKSLNPIFKKEELI
jgi:hypothetical protein